MLDNAADTLDGALIQYLNGVLKLGLQLRPIRHLGHLPAYLSKRYQLLEGEVAGNQCTFALTAEHTPPTQVTKHLDQIRTTIQKQSNEQPMVVYVTQRMASATRSRLIVEGTPFVVPGTQMFMPQLAIDLREKFSSTPLRSREQLSPVAQVVLFYHLLRSDAEGASASDLAKTLHYTAMSVGRAFEELKELQLVQVKVRGRRKSLALADAPRALLLEARAVLRSPAKITHLLSRNPNLLGAHIAGESALSALTDLAPPKLETIAMHHPEWHASDIIEELRDAFEAVDHEDEAVAAIELWHYRPALLTDNQIVDPLSLFATYWDHTDERVAQAAEDVLERLQW